MAEDVILNKSGFRQSMPEDWDRENAWARYDAINLKVKII
jgi:hypothetical protein